MNLSAVHTVRHVRHFTTCLTVSAACAFIALQASGDPATLRWNGAAVGTNLWNSTSLTWLDAGANAVAWQPGAVAQFDGNGGIVNIAADVTATNLVFTGNGYALLGAGRLSLSGGISVDAGKTNSLAADLTTVAGISKTGGGALAVTRCNGPLNVAEGTLLVSSRDTADADITVASGAALHVLGGPATNANLIANASFESPALASGAYAYATTTAISNWTAVASSAYVARQNTATGNAWNSAGAAPDLNHVLILQYGGGVAQTVTVASDGLYTLSFYHFLRFNYPDTPLNVYLGGARLTCFANQAVQFAPLRYVSAPLFLKAGAYELRLEGDSAQGDRASMVDLVCFAPPSETVASGTLTGLSTLRAATGATVRMAFSGSASLARVYINGALQAAGTFTSSHLSGIFTGSGSLSAAAPQNIYTWTGTSGNWSDTNKWESAAAPAGGQDLALRFPLGLTGAYTNDLAGTFPLNRLWASGLASNEAARFSGNGLSLTNTAAGVMPTLTLSGAGAAVVSTPIAVRTNLTLDVSDTLTLSGTLSYPLTNSYVVSKTGPGSVTLASTSGSPAGYLVNEGKVTFSGIHTGSRYLSSGGPFSSIPAGICLSSLPGRSASFYVTQTGSPVSSQVFFAGLGETIFGTRSGGTVTCDNWFTCFGTAATYDVGAGDTLRILQLVEGVNDSSIKSLTSVIKAGPGTAEVRSLGANNTTHRAYSGQTVLRNGTLTLSADDCGILANTNPFNNQTYDGRGGSLGYSAFTNTVRIGDSGTAPTDALALVANGNGRYIGHDIEILNKGASVTLNMTTGTVLFAGTVTLHRDIALTGPADGVMIFSNIVAAADFSGTGALPLSGLGGLRFEGSLPAATSLPLNGRLLRFGTYAVRAQTLNALAIGSAAASATLDVDFGAGVNDTVAVTASGGLTISNTVVNLYCAGTGAPFAEPGIYTLFTYAGTLGGDAALLSVGNPQSGAAYAFSNDAANSRVLLTISNTSGGSSATWKNPASGAWSLGANWDSGSVPTGAGVTPLFGLAITNPAAVAISTAYTVGGLTFNNGSYGYTLSGGSLTLDKGGPTPTVSVAAGTHTLDTTLNGSAGLSVSTAANATLILSTNAVANTGLSLAAGTAELRGNAAVNGATALAASTLLRVAATNASVGTLSGTSSATLDFNGTVPKLTVNQSGDGAFAGVLSGSSGAWLAKTGAGALALSGPNNAFSGTVAAVQGTLSLQGVALPGTLSVAAPASVTVLPAATNGLMGFYYNVTPNTNNFFTLAGMEAHFATLKPDFAAPSGLAGTNFDFGATGGLFPQPYGTNGTRTTNFEAVWRGAIAVPSADYYKFTVTADDGFLLAIDGKQIANRPYYVASAVEGTTFLEAGSHDMVLGLFQVTGTSGLQVQIRSLNGTNAPLSNAWLKTYSSVGVLSGNGALTLSTSNTQFTAAQNTSSTFSGDLSGPVGSLFTKSGAGNLTLSSASVNSNAFAGDVAVQGGILALATDERIGDASLVTIANSATLKLNAAETVGGLSGAGAVTLGGTVYATAFTGDADSGISASKTYTHLLDFPSGTADATNNGVVFVSSGMSGSRNGYSWNTTGTIPTSTQNNTPTDATRTGIDSLLWDFYYGSVDFTFTLSGLTPGKTYETRFYFRNYNFNPRNLTFTFTTGSATIGILDFNPDTITRSIVGCRYTADSTGALSIRIVSHSVNDTCHLYGLSNEEVPVSSPTSLTVNTPAGRTTRHTGAFTGAGALAKLGAGTQIFSGTNSVASPFDVQAGTLTFEPGASVLSGAVVRASATVAAPYGSVWLGGLKGAGTFSLAGITPYPTNVLYFTTFTNDATTGISTSKTYTHLLDFGTRASPATVINGVAFNKSVATFGSINGYGWTNFPATPHGGNVPPTVPVDSGIYNLLYDMDYGLQYPGSATMSLTGLTPGKRYEVRLYNRYWTSSNDRTQTLAFDPDGAGPISDAVTFNPDTLAPNFLAYRYTAVTSVLNITVASKLSGQTYHLYGLSNEQVEDAVYVPVVVDITRDSVLDGAVAGPGAWAKTGAASLTVTGESTATGLLSVNAGAFGVAGGGRATAGAVAVAAGATLFGDGRIGGNVTVSSNAWLMAGTASACGTLQVGGGLTLAQGTLLAYRFGLANSNDTVTVGGMLTFPTNGVVQASALGAGATAPAKDVFFSSTQTISGPADLVGWTVVGAGKASLKYSGDRKTIYFTSPRGTLLIVH